MNLGTKEIDKLLIHQVGSLAQKRLARGVKLNLSEATALIALVLHELIRDGKHSVAQLMQVGKEILGHRHVQPAVPGLLHDVQVEGTFPDGTFLVTVHWPICSPSGRDPHLSLALYGSFLHLPHSFDPDVHFPLHHSTPLPPHELPGAVVVSKSLKRKIHSLGSHPESEIAINLDRPRIRLSVINTGDRPIQIGSHYHLALTNPALKFDRLAALGFRLDIAAGSAVRFEPGDKKAVTLVQISGGGIVTGGHGLPHPLKSWTLGDRQTAERIVESMVQRGFGHIPSDPSVENPFHGPPFSLTRDAYAAMYGPTTGDKVQLGDTGLWVCVERDATVYGEELKFGGGKVIREGMGQATGRSDAETLDIVITNALIIDWSGIYKADIGLKDGLIASIGKAGNPDIQPSVTPGMVVGVNTEVIAGEGKIVTAGAIDAHVHYICPQLADEALSNGITTLIGGGTGPVAGTNATTCTPSSTLIRAMLTATDTLPLNFLFTGKGNDSGAIGLEEQIIAGAGGMKLHEDWGSTPSAIDTCLTVCDKYDVQCNIHTDTLNESGFVEDTISAFKNRVIHTYHTEGAGGGHAPDIIVVCGKENVLPSSTNPTRPYTNNTLDEHHDMLMVCHHLDPSIPEDIHFADSRIRGETVAAEDVLQDTGAISMISSDSQAMGRIGEVISRTWRTAAKMRAMCGPLDEDKLNENDNARVKRYISKYTINPAIVHGISHIVGDIAPGKLADLCIWDPASFGVRPFNVIKGGMVAWCQMGDANASIPTVQPVIGRPSWGSLPRAAAHLSYAFVSSVSIERGITPSYGLAKHLRAVGGCRSISKRDMKHNATLPKMKVDPESYRVEADGRHCYVDPAKELPLTQGYFIF